MKEPINFGYLPEEFSCVESADIVIIPVAYDGTSTWMKGADKGPNAIIEASTNMELYDIETDCEVYRRGIYTEETIDGDMTTGDTSTADAGEKSIREILAGGGFRHQLEVISDRPALKNRSQNRKLAAELSEMAAKWEIPFGQESALWPSAAGLVPASTAVICGVGPVAKDLYTPNEAVERISLLQRTLLIAEFLAKQVQG